MRYAYGGTVVHTVGTLLGVVAFFWCFYCFYEGIKVEGNG